MQKKAKEIQYFFYSQAFADGIRTTLAILLPALVSSYYNQLELGMAISLGALCVSASDAPGPIIHKKNGMLLCALFVFLVALVTSFARFNIYVLGLEIIFVCFLFSMFTVYGNRASTVGNAAILVMILTMDKPIPVPQVLPNSLLILAGGIWYLLISLLFYNLQPYRGAQRMLGDSIREIASYLSIKADFYNPVTDLENDYARLIAQQVVVNERQDAAREMLFKTRQIVKESTTTGRKLVWTFVETVDLFEDITASYYDYSSLRKRFGDTVILPRISVFIKEIASELSDLGVAIQMNTRFRSRNDFEERLVQLKTEIDATPTDQKESKLVLRKILVNLRRLVQRFVELNNYFEKEETGRQKVSLDHSRFISHQPLDPKILFNNITRESSVFKHAVRVTIGCTIGYIVAKTLSSGHHGYWILLTIAFMLKPAFSLTKQRNIQRITGTIIGGVVGILILLFIPYTDVRFALMVLFMIGTYSFQRIYYFGMVLVVTPFIIILFSFLGVGFIEVAKERISDTFVGCTIAFAASYFLFPTWESEQLKQHILKMIKANADYLCKIIEGLSGKKISLLEYKLVRKEVYVSSANLSAAFQRMTSEPKSKQTNSELVHQFVVLSHILFSNIATVATTLVSKEPRPHPAVLVQSAKRSLALLGQIIKKIDETAPVSEQSFEGSNEQHMEITNPDDLLLKDQLEFIQKVIQDIDKRVVAIAR